MSIEIPIAVSIISVVIAVASFFRNTKKDTTEEVEERASMNARVLTKLDAISDDLRDIKKDNQDMRKELNSVSDRVLVLEQRVNYADKVNFASNYAEKS